MRLYSRLRGFYRTRDLRVGMIVMHSRTRKVLELTESPKRHGIMFIIDDIMYRTSDRWYRIVLLDENDRVIINRNGSELVGLIGWVPRPFDGDYFVDISTKTALTDIARVNSEDLDIAS